MSGARVVGRLLMALCAVVVPADTTAGVQRPGAVKVPPKPARA